MNTLEKIFNTQIEKFRELKVKFDKLEEEKKDFNYDEKLETIKEKKEQALEEVNRSEIYSEAVKKAARIAIEQEFIENQKALQELYGKFWEKIQQILTERKSLREDPKYKEAMQARSHVIHAKYDVKKWEENRSLAQEQVKLCESKVEQAKKELELAKKELAWSNNKLRKIDETLDSYTKALSEVQSHFCERIKDTVTINEKIIDTVLGMMDKWITIDEKDLKKPLYDIIRGRIYSSSWIWRLWGWSKDVEDMVKLDLWDYTDNTLLKAWDKISLNCTCWNGENKITSELIITITWKSTMNTWLSNDIVSNSNDKMTEDINEIGSSTGLDLSEESQQDENDPTTSENNEDVELWKKTVSKKNEEKLSETDETIDAIKKYILNTNQNSDLVVLLKESFNGENIDERTQQIIKKLAAIYIKYDKTDDCLSLILRLKLPIEKMELFMDLAYGRSDYRGNNKEIIEEMKKTIEKLEKMNTSKKDRKDRDLQIQNSIGVAFWVNMSVELWISDIWKSGHILSWNCDGNSKRKRGKWRR